MRFKGRYGTPQGDVTASFPLVCCAVSKLLILVGLACAVVIDAAAVRDNETTNHTQVTQGCKLDLTFRP